jgi:hypothetical protein
MVRRLPVLNSPTGDDEADQRPPRAWVLIGGALVAALFLPSSLVGVWVGARLAQRFAPDAGSGSVLGALPVLAAFALSAWAGGALTGRFGVRTRVEHGVLVGAVGGSLVLLPALLARALSPASVALAAGFVLVLGGAFAAWLGARYGVSRRPGT